MPPRPDESNELRSRILKDPEAVLEDRDVMRALITAGGGSLGRNVVDLRGVLVERLENRLDRLEDTHRTVIAAAYENLAGTNQIHRAVLALLDHVDFHGFLRAIGHEVPGMLGVDVVRIGVETAAVPAGTPLGPAGDLQDLLMSFVPGGIEAYFDGARPGARRSVHLRQNQPDSPLIYGEAARWVRSEALMRLDLGEGRLPGVLLFAAEDPHRFGPDQGVDLLTFFGSVFEKVLRRWLA